MAIRMPKNIQKIPKNSKNFREHVVRLSGWVKKTPLMALEEPGIPIDDDVIKDLAINNEKVTQVLYHTLERWYAIKTNRGYWYQWEPDISK